MKRETAQLLLQAMADVTNRLNEALRAVQRTEANEVFVTYRRTVGELMGTMYFDVMSPSIGSTPNWNLRSFARLARRTRHGLSRRRIG